MGLPEIFISFQTAAVSAITRSARGVLAVAVKDATAGGAAEAAYKSLAEVRKPIRRWSVCALTGWPPPVWKTRG